MINKKKIFFFLIFILLNSCSFDTKTGIWGDSEKEKVRISELEKKQKNIVDKYKVYSSENLYEEEVNLSKNIVLSKPRKNLSWEMSGLNYQNFLGNIYLKGIDNIFLKKKIGKNKFSIHKIKTSLLAYKNSIIISDDVGTIINFDERGKIKWKKNIYNKIYKKIYKNLSFSIYKNIIYVSDNVGFIYALNFDNGKIIWIKKHGVPLKSNIKVFDEQIFLIDQDNKIFSLRIKDGTQIWDILSISSFIKSQNLLSLAISKRGNLIAVSSSADLFSINANEGTIVWATNISRSLFADATDFFRTTDIVLTDKEIIFSSGSSIFSYNLTNGFQNWENKNVSSIDAPIINGEHIFFVTENGFSIIMNKDSGEIISSKNILNILKKKNRETKITSFIMGSGKIYSFTLNGYLIESAANSGKIEYFKKIGDPVTSSPIISNGNLFVLTEDSKIFGFN